MRALRIPGFADRLAACLRAHRTTQSAFARQQQRRNRGTRITQSNLSRWMKNQVPSFESLEELATALGVPWEYLLLGEEGAHAVLRHLGAVSNVVARDPALRHALELVAQIRHSGDKRQWNVMMEILKSFRATTASRQRESTVMRSTRRR